MIGVRDALLQKHGKALIHTLFTACDLPLDISAASWRSQSGCPPGQGLAGGFSRSDFAPIARLLSAFVRVRPVWAREWVRPLLTLLGRALMNADLTACGRNPAYGAFRHAFVSHAHRLHRDQKEVHHRCHEVDAQCRNSLGLGLMPNIHANSVPKIRLASREWSPSLRYDAGDSLRWVAPSDKILSRVRPKKKHTSN